LFSVAHTQYTKMGFVKVVKNKAYYMRFQVKFRRRRECKTDYYARKRLVTQDKNKYKTPKYRFVVRFTNRDVVCQIIAADLTHDVVLAAAYSHELPRYGVKLGLTNFAAAYCTGLLLARRVNTKFNLKYEGTTDVNGEQFHVEAQEDGPRPFKALLDVGLARTTTGCKIFGALKGAADGGLDIPHNDRRFPGSKKENGEWVGSAETVRKYIFGGHVGDYMNFLKEEDEDKFNRQFKRYIDAGVNSASFEKLYTAAHKAIRSDPNKKRDVLQRGRFQRHEKAPTAKPVKKSYKKQGLSLQQKKSRVEQKLRAKGVKNVNELA
jgi:large subunit ribosomal protein L5e